MEVSNSETAGVEEQVHHLLCMIAPLSTVCVDLRAHYTETRLYASSAGGKLPPSDASLERRQCHEEQDSKHQQQLFSFALS